MLHVHYIERLYITLGEAVFSVMHRTALVILALATLGMLALPAAAQPAPPQGARAITLYTSTTTTDQSLWPTYRGCAGDIPVYTIYFQAKGNGVVEVVSQQTSDLAQPGEVYDRLAVNYSEGTIQPANVKLPKTGNPASVIINAGPNDKSGPAHAVLTGGQHCALGATPNALAPQVDSPRKPTTGALIAGVILLVTVIVLIAAAAARARK